MYMVWSRFLRWVGRIRRAHCCTLTQPLRHQRPPPSEDVLLMDAIARSDLPGVDLWSEEIARLGFGTVPGGDHSLARVRFLSLSRL
ncbi:unnamed protein product [Caenorhabditis auriculariae]|uniref:Uncharacterized protein n=1 Tax=Caenorhabditis auriculariae TaxID=2777116 RepID=A0A8S1GSB6_9PELO|nr:unnamed protein product [Caenorhabditis auriculariae]